MSYVEQNGRFGWGPGSSFRAFNLYYYTISQLFYTGSHISYEQIILSGWSEEDFLTAIDFREKAGKFVNDGWYIQDLRKNIKKYMNEAFIMSSIKEIIE